MKKIICILAVFILTLNLLSCDPVLPKENIKAICTSNPLKLNETAEIKIIYPNISDTAVVDWTTPEIEIVSGGDVVEMSGMTVTGIKQGIAILNVTVKAQCAFNGIIIDDPAFATEVIIEVVDG